MSEVGGLSVRRAQIGDEPVLRDLRLRALSDAPEAFGSTYERELARSTVDWQRWMSPGVTFLLCDSCGAHGMVAGMRDEADAMIVHLLAMWVDPKVRGGGAADSLVRALIAWANSLGAHHVELKVILGNDRAKRFYERMGFQATGRQEIRERDGRMEVQMERPA